jgi:hypothetical protein
MSDDDMSEDDKKRKAPHPCDFFGDPRDLSSDSEAASERKSKSSLLQLAQMHGLLAIASQSLASK